MRPLFSAGVPTGKSVLGVSATQFPDRSLFGDRPLPGALGSRKLVSCRPAARVEDNVDAIESELEVLLPRTQWTRRGFVMTSLATGFALSMRPVSAEAIHTDATGLEAGEVRVPVKDGSFPAYRAMPDKGGPFPTVLVIHEAWGVHEHIQDLCRRLAKPGYFAIAGEVKCPGLAVHGGGDQSIPQDTIDKRQAACKAAGKTCEVVVYPDAPHGFNADYRPSYRAEAATDGWAKMLAWFKDHGAA